jgi:seryl-tRNA synthetase
MVKILHRHSEADYNKTIKIKTDGTKIQKNLLPLNSLINQKQKKVIIKKIFGNSHAEFEQFVQELEAITEWTAALKRVEAELNKREISLHNPHAVLFTNILFARYFPEAES